MNYNETMTNWLVRLNAGDEGAIGVMFGKYYRRAIALASRKMNGINASVRSSEDIALSAMKSLCFKIREKKVEFETTDDLWGCLICITGRKLCAQRRHDLTVKRGKDYLTVSGNQKLSEEIEDEILDVAVGREPSPEFAAALAEDADELLNLFQNDRIAYRRDIILLKLKGFSVKEISKELGLVERTVFWNLDQIKEKWKFYQLTTVLIENLFQGAPRSFLTRTLDWSEAKIDRVVELSLELWQKETSDDETTELLRLKFFDAERYRELLDVRDARVWELEKGLGKLCDHWLSRVRQKWASVLRMKIKKEFPEETAQENFPSAPD